MCSPASCLLVAAALAVAVPVHAQTFHSLDEYAALSELTVRAVSDDGLTVVGSAQSSRGVEAFRWTARDGIEWLGDLPGGGFRSFALAVSEDGSVVVGGSTSASGTEAFRWSAGGGMVGLGDLAGGAFASVARGVSADGAVVVGGGVSASGEEAFRWTSAGMTGLGDLGGGAFQSTAYAVSGDGRVVVGGGTSGDGPEAFRWTEAAGLEGLGDLAEGLFASVATGASQTGAVIVGEGTSALGAEAFRWTEEDEGEGERVMRGLGSLNTATPLSRALAVSADGTTVVGETRASSGSLVAFRWTLANGMEEIGSFSDPVFPAVATGVSANGSVVVGEDDGSPISGYRWTSGVGVQVIEDLPDGPAVLDWDIRAVSGDGRAIVGRARPSSDSVPQALRWSDAGGFEWIGAFPSGDGRSDGNATSRDGSVVVGGSRTDAQFQAFRQSAGAGFESLGGVNAVATGVSDNGMVVVGEHFDQSVAFRWTEDDGMIPLGDLPGGNAQSEASAVSADGEVVVGTGWSDDGIEAFRWASGAMVGLGDLPGGQFRSYAYDVSADGSTVVGESLSSGTSFAFGYEAFRWTSGGGMQALGLGPGATFSTATQVTGDGATVFGVAGRTGRSVAMVWETGGRTVRQMLEADYGLDLTGWQLERVDGVSDDGMTIVGTGTNPQGQRVRWRALLGDAPPTQTSLTDDTAPGAEALAVSSTAPFAVGDRVTIGPGSATEETRTVVGFGSLRLDAPLQFAHAAGEAVVVTGQSTSAEADGARAFALATHPNPTGGAATVRLTLAASAHVYVEVFDALGRRVARLHDGPLAAGDHLLALDATGLPAGLYLVRAQTEAEAITRRLTVVR